MGTFRKFQIFSEIAFMMAPPPLTRQDSAHTLETRMRLIKQSLKVQAYADKLRRAMNAGDRKSKSRVDRAGKRLQRAYDKLCRLKLEIYPTQTPYTMHKERSFSVLPVGCP